MENIIGEHFGFSKSFSSFALIFNLEPEFFNVENGIIFFDKLVYQKNEANIEEGIFRNQKEEGYWILGNLGQKESEGFFRNGKANGFWIFWYPNAQEESEGNFKNGLKNGLWFYWRPDGRIEKEGNYLNNEKEGLWKFWDKRGNLSTVDFNEEID